MSLPSYVYAGLPIQCPECFNMLMWKTPIDKDELKRGIGRVEHHSPHSCPNSGRHFKIKMHLFMIPAQEYDPNAP